MKDFLHCSNLLERVTAETIENQKEAKRLTEDLTEEQLNWKPSAESWSVAQCLDHLTVAGAGFDSIFTEALERGRRKWPVSSVVPYRPSLIGGLLIRQIVPENARRINAPKVFRPSASEIRGSLQKYLQQEEKLLGFVREAKGIDYNKTRLRSPVTSLIRYSLADAFVVIVVHGRRHLLQAQRVLNNPGFPKV
jgi:hypothetical protein